MSTPSLRKGSTTRPVVLGLVLAFALYLVGPAVIGALDSVSTPNILCTGFAGDTGITGSVTEDGTGDPIPGAWVAVLRTSDFSIVGGVSADDEGLFEIPVPPGSYFVYLIDPSAQHPAGFAGAPELVEVAENEVVDVAGSMAATRGSVAGTVTEQGSGDPLPDAVALAIGGPSTALEVARVTDAGGAYHLPGLAAGNHFVGYFDPAGAHATRFYPDSANVPESSPVAVSVGATTIADAALPVQAATPGGATLSGTLTDAVNDEPVPYAIVVALQAADYQFVRGGFTDAAGQYDLDVAAGEYKLAFVDARGWHEMEWYDDLPNTGLADAVSAPAPGVADAALVPTTGSIVGTLLDATTGFGVGCAWAVAIGPNGIAGGAPTDGNGLYRIDGLAPGTYRVTFADAPGGRTQEYWDDSADYDGATPIVVTAGAIEIADATLGFPPPDNDDFADAHDISGGSGELLGTTNGASLEPGEPDHGGGPFTGSVWYRWTAPGTGHVWVDTCQSPGLSAVAVYTGDNLGSLVPVPSATTSSCGGEHSEVSFPVVDGTEYRLAVQGFSGAGGEFGDVLLRWGMGETPPTLADSWEGVGAFHHLAVAPNGDVYATDPFNDRVVVLDDTGAPINEFGTTGSGPGEFSSPLGIGVDASGNVFVLDSGNDRVQKFAGDGTFLLEFGSFGSGSSEFSAARDLAVTPSGEVVVSDINGVQRFDAVGTFLARFGLAPGELHDPGAIAVAPTGGIFVFDDFWQQVHEFTGTGTHVGTVGEAGVDLGQFSSTVWGLAVDPLGHLLVLDSNLARVQEFDSTGQLVARWGRFGSGPDQFFLPSGIASDAFGTLYVADSGNGRIQVYEP
ncbi:MAG: hypothetical protein KDB10_19605 [Acidimicrobiales bacterium]|nr:hypothetical protein [Acidimicrobiales bacterium]MCB9372453.1 hypothetical protein [Microthrixaceae bacterium]